MHPSRSPQERRSNFLSIFLAGMASLFFLFLLILLTSGFFFYVGGIVLFFVAVCSFHYLLWGKAFSEQVAGEREEEQLRQRAADTLDRSDWNYPPRTDIKR